MNVNKWVILGILCEQPLHGYALKQAMAPGIPRQKQLNDGVMYPLLKKLEQEGFIESKQQKEGRRPTRKVYAATAEGQAAFQAWLDGETDEEDPLVYDLYQIHPFVSKLLFAEGLSKDVLIDKIDQQMQTAKDKLGQLQSILGHLETLEGKEMRREIVAYNIASQDSYVRWLTKLRQSVLDNKIE